MTSHPTDLKTLSNAELTLSFSLAAKRERLATADLISHLREFSRRRLHLDHGHTSIFSYLTKELGFSEATAQNRIDAARLVEAVPQLQNDLANGAINLTQVSILSRSIRQKERESDRKIEDRDKVELLEKIKSLDSKSSALVVARELDLNLRPLETNVIQKDESVVLQLTFSKEQMEDLKRVKDLASHVDHNAGWSDVVARLAKYYIENKDPLVKTTRAKKARPNLGPTSQETKFTSDPKSAPKPEPKFLKPRQSLARKSIPTAIQRAVFRRDQSCRWPIHADPTADPKADRENGFENQTRKCESTFQLQFDHIKSVCDGGGNEIENLQILCGRHNRLKYERGLSNGSVINSNEVWAPDAILPRRSRPG